MTGVVSVSAFPCFSGYVRHLSCRMLIRIMIDFWMMSPKISVIAPFSACGTTLFHINGAGPE